MAEEKRKKSQILPLLLAFLVFIATSSFYHAFHLLLTTDTGSENSIEISLKEFKLGAEQVKPHDVPAIKSPHDVPAIKSLPNPVLADGQESFSACLLVMDDNNRLVEWLAYHYHVLPLRYLVVAVDPRSKTSPTDILNRWRQMGVHVEEWTDYDFMKPSLAARPVDDNAELHIKRDRHRIRQKWFYRQCLMHMGQANRTYVTMVDTDEYVTYNHKGQDQFEAWEQAQMKLHSESQFYEKKRIRPSQPPPTTAEAGALIQYIRQEKAANHPFFQRACISCPRLQFGAKESTLKKRQAHVPEQVDSERLDSLRFRKHAYRNDFVKNGLSKSIIDVSRIDYTNIPRIQSLHRPIKTICSPPWKDEWDSGLRINHYLGSWEAYSFRDDSRKGGERSREGWEFKARDADDTDDNIRPWIGGFVQEHGNNKAKELLQGAGLDKSYKNPDEKAWTIMFLDEIMGVNVTKGNDIRVEFDNFVREMHHKKVAEE